MARFLGLDPGGRSSSAKRKAGEAFNWALLRGEDLLKVVKTGTVNDAKGAVGVFTDLIQEDRDPLLSVGIDAPLFWQPGGGRAVDRRIRDRIRGYRSSSATVNDVNSKPSACLIQGMVTAMLIRDIRADIPITEAHPKALLWLIGIAHRELTPDKIYLGDLDKYITGQEAVSEHVRDAALGALTAFAMISKLDGWENLFPCECEPITPLAPPPGYWMPL